MVADSQLKPAGSGAFAQMLAASHDEVTHRVDSYLFSTEIIARPSEQQRRLSEERRDIAFRGALRQHQKLHHEPARLREDRR